jgi:hypothetical protein
VAESLPPTLRDEVARTLRPVKPLASPRRRTAVFVPLAGLLLAAVPLLWGLREDAAVVGALPLWAGSALQAVLALGLLATALAECVPGRLHAPSTLVARAALAVGFMIALTGATFLVSPNFVPGLHDAGYFRICLTRSFGLGLAPLAMAGLLLRRGLATRPVVAGALAGLGAGLLADAGWRLFCEVSDPAHVLTAHAGAIALLGIAGAFAGVAFKPKG